MLHGFCLNFPVLESVLCPRIPPLWGRERPGPCLAGRRLDVKTCLHQVRCFSRTEDKVCFLHSSQILQDSSRVASSVLFRKRKLEIPSLPDHGAPPPPRGSTTARLKRSAGRRCRPGPCPPGSLFCRSPRGSPPRPQPEGGLEVAPARWWPQWGHKAQRSASKEKQRVYSRELPGVHQLPYL